jgi:hypothetical protein
VNEPRYSGPNASFNVAARDGQPAFALIRGLVGAIAGAVAGFFAFQWMASQGFYAMVLPGALMGLGCGYASGRQSKLLGGLCAISAIPVGLLCEALVMPFVADKSLGFFFSHLGELSTVTWLMIGAGAIMSYWFGVGRDRR